MTWKCQYISINLKCVTSFVSGIKKKDLKDFVFILQVAYSRIHSLEAYEASLKSSVKHLEARVLSLEEEKEALLHSLCIMKKRLEKLEKSRIEGHTFQEEEDHAPPFGIVYALAGSEKEEDKKFKQLMKKISLGKEPEGSMCFICLFKKNLVLRPYASFNLFIYFFWRARWGEVGLRESYHRNLGGWKEDHHD